MAEGLAAAQASGDDWPIAYALFMQGNFLRGLARYDEAYACSREALARFQALGDTRLIAVTSIALGLLAMFLGRYPEARAVPQESLALIARDDDRWTIGIAHGAFGQVERAQGHWAEALAQFTRSVALFAELGMPSDRAIYLNYVGEAAAALGQADEAHRHWLEALRLGHEAHAWLTVLAALLGLAQLRAGAGDSALAFAWLTQVWRHPASTKDTRDRADRLRRELEAQLTSQRIDAAQAQPAAVEAIVDGILHDRS